MTVTIDGLAGVTTPAIIYPGFSSGTITVNAPFTNGTFLINFPAANGTVVLVDTNGAIALTSPLGGKLTISPPNTINNTNFVFPTTSGTNGDVLTTDGAGNTYWGTNSSSLAVGSTAISGGAAGSSLLTKVAGTLQEIVMGTGVATALGNTTNAVGGLVTYNGPIGTTPQIAGSTSGNLTLQAQASASGTLTLPNGNGTLIASSSSTLTQGSVLFVGASGRIDEDNAKFFWDNTNDQLIVGANTTVTSPANIQLAVTKDAYINGITVGLGAGQITTNTVVGNGAFVANTSGANNVALGKGALAAVTTGSNNIALGVNSGNDSLGTLTTASNQIIIGNALHTSAFIQCSFTVVSDVRDKNVLGDVKHGLDFVEKLQPIRYRFKEHRDSAVAHGPVRYGFSAQDILALEGGDNVLIDTTDKDKLKFTESGMVPILVNAIRELSDKVKLLEAQVASSTTK